MIVQMIHCVKCCSKCIYTVPSPCPVVWGPNIPAPSTALAHSTPINTFTATILLFYLYLFIYRHWMCNRSTGTGWRRLIGYPKLQIIFHKRATKYRSLLRKMTYKDKRSYESSPSCTCSDRSVGARVVNGLKRYTYHHFVTEAWVHEWSAVSNDVPITISWHKCGCTSGQLSQKMPL